MLSKNVKNLNHFWVLKNRGLSTDFFAKKMRKIIYSSAWCRRRKSSVRCYSGGKRSETERYIISYCPYLQCTSGNADLWEK